MIDTRWGLVLALLLAAVMAFGIGCRSGPETNGEARERPRRAPQDMAMPSPEELGDNPCGNPNWAQLPRGVGEMPADDDGEEAEEADEADEAEEESIED